MLTDTLHEAERRVIGSALVDPTIYGRVQIDATYFDDKSHHAIWEAMGTVHDAAQPIDPLAVANALGSLVEACGGLAYLSGLMLDISTTANVDHYVDIVRDKYLRRRVEAKARELLAAPNDSSGEDLLGQLQVSSEALTCSLSRPNRTLDLVVREEINAACSASGEASGVPTGWGVDRWFPGGLAKGKIATLFADTGTFKTTGINQFMFNAAACGHKGLLIPLEDSDELTAHRWISRETGVHYGKIAGGVINDTERHKIKNIKPGEWASLKNIATADGIEPRIEHAIRAVASHKARSGIDFVVLDYIQLLEGKGEQAAVLTNAMRRAANCAKRYDVMWLMVSQQNDRSEGRVDPRPSLRDMFGSAAMKQASKTVLALFRPYEHWPKPSGKKHPLWGGYVNLIEKHGYPVYKNILELWMLKNVLGRKQAVAGLLAKPEVGILEPVDLKEMTL